jgi:5-methylcytosine-specific restriction endonuclease McrA
MKTAEWMARIAATDRTFRRAGDRWIGKCLICNGPLAFDAGTGLGANIEHIVPRTPGGTHDLLNLGITHPGCNGEKGVHWDAPRRHRANPTRYAEIVARLLAERRRRWREPA